MSEAHGPGPPLPQPAGPPPGLPRASPGPLRLIVCRSQGSIPSSRSWSNLTTQRADRPRAACRPVIRGRGHSPPAAAFPPAQRTLHSDRCLPVRGHQPPAAAGTSARLSEKDKASPLAPFLGPRPAYLLLLPKFSAATLCGQIRVPKLARGLLRGPTRAARWGRRVWHSGDQAIWAGPHLEDPTPTLLCRKCSLPPPINPSESCPASGTPPRGPQRSSLEIQAPAGALIQHCWST